MVKLNAPIWQTLGFTGSVAQKCLKDLIEENGDIQENIEILADNLSHQLSWYETTAYVLPHLANLFPKLSSKDKVFMIAQMGAAIATEATEPLLADTEAYHEFQEGIEGLRKEVTPFITDNMVHALLAEDDEIVDMFCLGVLAIIGDRKHAYNFWWLSGWGLMDSCAACECGWNYEAIPFEEQLTNFEKIEIDVWDKKSLDNEVVWLNGLLEVAGDNTIRQILPLVYGMGKCPVCGNREPYWDWLERFIEEY